LGNGNPGSGGTSSRKDGAHMGLEKKPSLKKGAKVLGSLNQGCWDKPAKKKAPVDGGVVTVGVKKKGLENPGTAPFPTAREKSMRYFQKGRTRKTKKESPKGKRRLAELLPYEESIQTSKNLSEKAKHVRIPSWKKAWEGGGVQGVVDFLVYHNIL